MNDAKPSTKTETPLLLVPQATPCGVRYVRPLAVRRRGLGPFLHLCLFALGVLAAATAFAVATLVQTWERLEASAVALALLYPLQLTLDLAAVARCAWQRWLWSLGDLEIELTDGCLRAGKRWGTFWYGAQTLPLGSLRQLVIVQRPAAVGSGFDWELVAQPEVGPPLVFVSAYDEPALIRAIAMDLQGRLASNPARPRDLPPLLEVDEPRRPPAARPRARSLVPSGGFGWLVVHGLGSIGLWFTGVAVFQHLPRAPWRTAVLAAVVLQIGVVLVNVSYLLAAHHQPSSD
jgi:hypothetical protein